MLQTKTRFYVETFALQKYNPTHKKNRPATIKKHSDIPDVMSKADNS